ncbi:MAG TPA: universal stress protein [Anaerolineales bacterium]
MINHILIPLDGSALAECVLAHVLTIARSANARVTLLHVLELSHAIDQQAVDPLEWYLKKQEAQEYLRHVATKLQQHRLVVQEVLLEGSPAECVIDYAHDHDVDLIALSSHGQSGLSGWNVSSVVQKIIVRSFKSILLIRAYIAPSRLIEKIRYSRLFVGLDISTRAEYILPVAVSLAQFYEAELTVGMVVRKPEILHRFPLSHEEEKLVNKIADGNYRAASHYFDQLQSHLSMQGINLQTRLVVSDNVTASIHDMVERENPDLVMLVAHGQTGESRWPYGSIATSFIAYGTTSLMIMQDLSGDEIKRTQAEIAAREVKGH